MSSELITRFPQERDEASFKEAVRQLASSDPDTDFAFHFDPDGDFAEYVRRVREASHGRELPDGWVANSFLIGVVADRVVGRVSLRHELNQFLLDFGGHVGFAVVPEYRRRGYATQMLIDVLPRARAVGIDRLLVTCDERNLASRTIIERCGGLLEDSRPRPDGGRTRRYWIALAA